MEPTPGNDGIVWGTAAVLIVCVLLLNILALVPGKALIVESLTLWPDCREATINGGRARLPCVSSTCPSFSWESRRGLLARGPAPVRLGLGL